MSIKCVYCGGRHQKIESVKQCAAEARESKTSTPVFGLSQQVAQKIAGTGLMLPPSGAVPSGRYWSGNSYVIEVRVPVEGRWKGRYFINVSADGGATWSCIFSKADRDRIVGALLSSDYGGMMREYGRRVGECSVCGLPLLLGERSNGVHGKLNEPGGPVGECARTVLVRTVKV